MKRKSSVPMAMKALGLELLLQRHAGTWANVPLIVLFNSQLVKTELFRRLATSKQTHNAFQQESLCLEWVSVFRKWQFVGSSFGLFV